MVTVETYGGVYYDVPMSWAVDRRKELPAPAEVLFRDPGRARRIDIGQVPWQDEYRYVIAVALQLCTREEADMFSLWLKMCEGNNRTAVEVRLPISDDGPFNILPLDGGMLTVSMSDNVECDLPFEVSGTAYCRDGRWE